MRRAGGTESATVLPKPARAGAILGAHATAADRRELDAVTVLWAEDRARVYHVLAIAHRRGLPFLTDLVCAFLASQIHGAPLGEALARIDPRQ